MAGQQKKILYLNVLNVDVITSSMASSYLFSQAGGVLGTSPSAEWQFTDCCIASNHANIFFDNREFRLKEMDGDVHINDSVSSVGKHKIAAIHHGDTILLGKYLIRATVLDASQDPAKHIVGRQSLDEIISDAGDKNQYDILASLSIKSEYVVPKESSTPSLVSILDTQDIYDSSDHADPLALLDGDSHILSHVLFDDSSAVQRVPPIQQDLSGTTTAHFSDISLSVESVPEDSIPPIPMVAIDSSQEHSMMEPASLQEHETPPKDTLHKILQELSPELLMQSFARYESPPENKDDRQAWAWGMYEYFYQDTVSGVHQEISQLLDLLALHNK